MRLFAIVLILVLAFSVMAGERPSVGQKAINFTLETFDGKRVALNQLRGRVILLDFWATWCPPCREELPYLDILQQTYGTQGFVVLAVNIDNKIQNAQDFLKAHDIKLMPLWDEQKKVVAQYDIEQMPTTVIIDKRGVIRYLHSGFETDQYIKYKQQIQQLLREKGSGGTTTMTTDTKS